MLPISNRSSLEVTFCAISEHYDKDFDINAKGLPGAKSVAADGQRGLDRACSIDRLGQ
jgi:hypothetical protein